MKKIFIVAFAAMLCIVTFIPVSAQTSEYDFNGLQYSTTAILDMEGDLRELGDIGFNILMYRNTSLDYVRLIMFSDYSVTSYDDKWQLNLTDRLVLKYTDGKWVIDDNFFYPVLINLVHWTTVDIAFFDNDFNEIVIHGDTLFFKSSTECDGSSCPATDANYDNICDDCGKPLTMSLRNTLYEYALWLAESKVADGYNYYAIFKSSDTYYVHISKAPMSSPDGTVLEGDGMMYNRVTQSADGVNGGSGWYNGFYESYDEFVEANHTISNFKGALPLAVKILGVVGEQITLKLPALAGLMMTLLACGVGCLALLVVLKLFGKRLLIFRK